MRISKRAIILFSICIVASAQQINVGINSLQKYTTGGGLSGDTWHFTDWTASGGNFTSGRVFGTANDDLAASNLKIVELTAYNPANPAGTTIATINAMSSYGASSALQCLGGSTMTNKTYQPWSWHGTHYINVFCQDNGPTYFARGSFMLVSDDNWAHACNAKTYAANAFSCPHNSTTAAGDSPGVGDPTAVLWPGTNAQTDTTNPMTRLAPIQICQDFSVSCPVPISDCNPAQYVCFITATGTWNDFHLARVDMTAAGNAMVAANYTYWTGSAWSALVASIGSIAKGWIYNTVSDPTYLGQIHSCIWSPVFKKFILQTTQANTGNTVGWLTFSTADDPKGPYTRVYSAPSTTPGGLPAMILALYSELSSAPAHAKITIGANGGAGASPPAFGYGPGFIETDFSAISSPLKSNVSASNLTFYQAAGNRLSYTPSHNSPYKFSLGNAIHTAPRSGLLYWLDFFDNQGNTNWPWFGSTDLLGSANYCNGGTSWSSTGLQPAAGCSTPGNAPSVLAGNGTWTITATFSTSNVGQSGQAIVTTYDGGTSWLELLAGCSPTGNLCAVWDIAGSFVIAKSSAGAILSQGVIYHATWTKTAGAVSVGAGGTLHMYVGATEIPLTLTGSGTPNNTAAPLFFGHASTDQLQGTLYSSGLWNRVLTYPEIVQTYNTVKSVLALPERAVAVN